MDDNFACGGRCYRFGHFSQARVYGSGSNLAPSLLLGVWVGAGIITLFGALTNAEIASMIPQTGGQYVYFKKCTAILRLFVWMVYVRRHFTGGVASIAHAFGEYAQHFVALPRFALETEHSFAIALPFIGTMYPLQNIGVKLLTICIIILLTAINYRSVSAGGRYRTFYGAQGSGDCCHCLACVYRFARLMEYLLHNATTSPTMGWDLWQRAYGILGAFWDI